MTIKIYIEGGGEGKDLDSRFREAWTRFFIAAGLAGHMPRPVRGKGRANTFDLFSTAVHNSKANEMPLLLVDSEEAMAPNTTVWQHLKTRDNWDKPPAAADEQAYLMVQVMETWLLADPEALREYFGSDFKSKKLPIRADLEAVPKLVVFDALDKATAECDEKQYAKGKISFEILGKISPEKVKGKCPHAKKLLDFLSTKR